MRSTPPMLRRIQVMEGPLTIYTATEQKDVLLSLFPLAHEVELDLSNVDELDSAGLQLLILIKRESFREGAQLLLSNPSPTVIEALRLSGLEDYFANPSFAPSAGA
ncbi:MULTISPECIES: STAS domain-containing protein [unclassified Pseudomonas]|uniref:STAS domain-containing protein n=1 Tax=Pseudomonas TaxID=286 RepID=UPI0004746245|nr:MULTISPECIES: STAS domain-containing protein [unclassified Pseudomonas]